MAGKFVGIDLGTHEVKVCVVSSGVRRTQVLNVFTERAEIPETGDAEDAVDGALEAALRVLRERGLMHQPVGVALPGGSASYRALSFPFSDAKRVSQAVGFEVDGQFPMPLDELSHDHVIVPTQGKTGRALVVAARSELVERVNTTLKGAGVDVRIITVGGIGLAQALDGMAIAPAAEDVGTQPVSLVVDVGYQTTELVVMGEKGPLAARTIRRGMRNVERGLMRAYRLDKAGVEVVLQRDTIVPHTGIELDEQQQALGDTVLRALQPLLREIEHTRHWVRTECDALVTEIRLAGGGASLRGFDVWLAQQTGLRVGAVEPIGALKAADGRDWSRGIVALGAALGVARRPMLQLRDFEAAVSDGSFLEERFGNIAMLGVAILAFAAVDSLVKVKALERERNAYEDELALASEKAFGEPLYTEEEVQAALDAVSGADLSRQVPERGAFELLALISDIAKASAPPANIDPATGVPLNPDGSPAVPTDPSGQVVPPGEVPPVEGEEGLLAALPPVDPNAGIVWDDALEVSFIDLRPLKVKIVVSAARATAQDRLALKLEQQPCINGVIKGKIKDSNARKVFEMNLDHNCNRGNDEAAAPAADAKEGDE